MSLLHSVLAALLGPLLSITSFLPFNTPVAVPATGTTIPEAATSSTNSVPQTAAERFHEGEFVCGGRLWKDTCPLDTALICTNEQVAYCGKKRLEFTDSIYLQNPEYNPYAHVCDGQPGAFCGDDEKFVCERSGWKPILSTNDVSKPSPKRTGRCVENAHTADVPQPSVKSETPSMTQEQRCNEKPVGTCATGFTYICEPDGNAYCTKPLPTTPVVQQTTQTPTPPTSALGDFANCLQKVNAEIAKMRAENAIKKQNCLEEHGNDWSAGLICSAYDSVNVELMTSACTGKYEPYQAPKPVSTYNLDQVLQQQKQQEFNNNTCMQLGGTVIGTSCSYPYRGLQLPTL